jgi:hypothetical protein
VFWAADRQARVTGAIVRDVLKEAGNARRHEAGLTRPRGSNFDDFEMQGPAGYDFPRGPTDAKEVATFGRECQSCHKRTAAMQCSVHGIALCSVCLPKHDANGKCSFTLPPHTPGANEKPKRLARRMMTSPLSGSRD